MTKPRWHKQNKTKKKKILGRVIVIAMITSMFMVVFPMTASAATGDDCTDPIVVSIPGGLPYTDTDQTTCGRVDDYDATCLGYYDSGDDIIYRLDVTADTRVDITMDPKGTGWTGICIDDVCPPDGTCIAKATGSPATPRTLTCIDLTAGNSYYIMVDTWSEPDCIPDFDLTITANSKIKRTVHPTDPAADYTTIQDAIDAACAGDSIEVWNSTYYENVVVDKRLTIYSRDGADVTIVDGGDSGHVFEVEEDRVSITGFTVTNSGSAGIYVRSDHNNITGNTVDNNNGHGVDMDGDYNNVTYNTVNNNDGYGILLYGADFNNIADNTANNSGESGIFLSSYCNDNVVSTNTITDNGKIGVYSKAGIQLKNADDNEIVCNLVAYNVEKGFHLHGGSIGNEISYNNIISNGVCNATSGGWEWNFHNEQTVDNVDAENNYWCTCSVKTASIKEDPGTVDSEPFLFEPSDCAPMQPCIPCTLSEPGIEVNKTVWNGTAWVEETTAEIGEIVRFRCEIHNSGTCCPLTNFVVTDILSDSLEYADTATVNGEPWEPTIVSPNEFVWEFPEWVLEPCETITIEFDTHVIKCGVDVNTQTVTAVCVETGEEVFNEDTATVVVPPKPGIEVNKTVWDQESQAWVEETTAEISEIVRFRCEIHNNGTCCPLTNFVVTDILSDSLEYADTATVNGEPWEPTIVNPNEFMWEFPEWVLEPCETITIEFDALVIKGGYDCNVQNATAICVETGVAVSDEDTACVDVPEKPDLEIVDKWEEWVNETHYTVSYIIHNNGTAIAPACHNTTLYVDGVAIEHKHVPVDLAPCETYTDTFDTTIECTGDSDTIRVCADNYEVIDELDETNNCLENEWRCKEKKPDLEIVEKGEEGVNETHYTVSYVIHNNGTAIAPACHNTTLYVDGVAIEHKHVPVDLAPCETYTDTFDTVIECTDESDTVRVCADNYDAVDELYEDNNCVENVLVCPSSPPIPVPEFNAVGLLGLIGILSVVLAIAASRKK